MSEQVRIALGDILEGMEFQSDEVTAYVHRLTGRVIIVSDEALRAAEQGTGDELGSEPAELADAKAILAGRDDYLPLPDRFEIDEYHMMVDFASRIQDPAARAEVSDALPGSGAFRRFKDAVHRLGLADDWYAQRDRGYEQVARQWCAENGLALDAGIADA